MSLARLERYRGSVTSEIWRPLSERDSAGQALREGVPATLEGPLRKWVVGALSTDSGLSERVAVRCSIVRDPDADPAIGAVEYLGYFTTNDELLDAVDALLDLLPTGGWLKGSPSPGYRTPPRIITEMGALESGYDYIERLPLQQLLNDARSAYTIRSDGRALVGRIDGAVADAVDKASSMAEKPDRGSASAHLRAAIDTAYALHPEPSRAYSEAIKAVEAAAHATLQPNNHLATLGTMLGDLRQIRDKLEVAIAGPTGIEGIDAIEALMRLLWTGQTSRHGGQQPTKEETQEQATMAAHIAALLVQVFASGTVHRL